MNLKIEIPPLNDSYQSFFFVNSTLSEEKVLKALSGKLVRDGITAKEFYVLNLLFFKSLDRGDTSLMEVLFVILLSSTSRKRVKDWSSMIRPLRKNLPRSLSKEQVKIINSWLNDSTLIFQDILKNNLSIEKVHLEVKPPKEVKRVGVGYKDHGSIRPPHKSITIIGDGDLIKLPPRISMKKLQLTLSFLLRTKGVLEPELEEILLLEPADDESGDSETLVENFINVIMEEENWEHLLKDLTTFRRKGQ